MYYVLEQVANHPPSTTFGNCADGSAGGYDAEKRILANGASSSAREICEDAKVCGAADADVEKFLRSKRLSFLAVRAFVEVRWPRTGRCAACLRPRYVPMRRW